jgi:serralysin
MTIYDGSPGVDAPTLDDFSAMYGEGGNDILFSLHVGFVYIEGGTGDDHVGIIAAAGFGSFYGGDGNDFVVGHRLNDSLYGGDDNDLLAGGAYDATINGAQLTTSDTSGDDYLEGGAGVDGCYGFDGKDTIYGGDGNDRGTVSVLNFGALLVAKAGLFGGAGNDYIDGGRGNDWLDGGRGKDSLVGGLGKDVFDFNSIKDSKPGKADTIWDFSHAQHDRIDLSNIDAKTTKGGNQAFKFIGADAFHDKAGELRFKNGVLSGDVNGDGSADFQVKLADVSSLHDTDLIL